MTLTGVKMWNKLTSTIHSLQSGNTDRRGCVAIILFIPECYVKIADLGMMTPASYLKYGYGRKSLLLLFNELLGKLREVLTGNSVKETFDPATTNFWNNLVLQEKEDVKTSKDIKTSDKRLQGSTYFTKLDEVLIGMVKGKR